MIKRIKLHILENRRLLNEINDKLTSLQASNSELLFAQYFRDSIQNSSWVYDKGFSAYAGAANYSLLYKLYKILDIIKPENVLEFGLGQTTKMTSQYAEANSETKVLIIDDDQEWVDIYKEQTNIPKNLKLVTTGLQDFKYDGKVLQKMNEYAGLEKTIGKTKFNLIIVDGPIGYDKEYSRTNVVSLVTNLAKSWTVVFDDAERPGEQHTIDLFREQLQEHGTEYSEFRVDSNKTQHYFCSKELYKTLYAI